MPDMPNMADDSEDDTPKEPKRKPTNWDGDKLAATNDERERWANIPDRYADHRDIARAYDIIARQRADAGEPAPSAHHDD